MSVRVAKRHLQPGRCEAKLRRSPCAISKSQSHSTSRRAFTLLEILVVMSVLVVVLFFGIAILGSAMRVWHASIESQNEWNHRHMLADRFRADVHRATETPERTGEWTAGPTCLILRSAGGTDIIYQWKAGQLERLERPGEGVQRVPCSGEGASVEFVRAGAERRLITLKLTQQLGSAARVQQFSAALGGDLR